MKRLYFLVLMTLACSQQLLAQASGDYVATVSMEWNSANWSISNGAGGYSSTGNTAPTSTKNVWILNGVAVTVTTTAATCASLTINNGGALSPTATTTVSGPMEVAGTLTMGAGAFSVTGATTVDGTVNMTGAGAFTQTGALTINGTWYMPSGSGTLGTSNNVTISPTGVLKGGTTAGGTVQTVNFGGASPTITVNGQLGAASKGVSGESLRVYPTGSGTTTFTGTGNVFLARFQPNSTSAQTIVIDINMNFNTSSNTATGFTLQNSAATSAAKTLTINAGKTVTLSNASCGFHNIASATSAATNFGDMIYNVNGTLDCSIGAFVFYSSSSATTPTPISSQVINVGSAGVLKLGANVRMAKAQTGQTVSINVSPGGIVDGSGTALNLTTTPVSANGTGKTDNVWFSLASGAVYKRLVTAGVVTPLWIGPTSNNYNPVTLTPTTTSVFTAAVANGNTPSGLANATKALNDTWTITPATASSTTVTLGYNGTAIGAGDANSGCDPTANMRLWYNNGSNWSVAGGTAVTPATGTENDKTVTFTGVTAFPTFAVVNDYALSTVATLSGLTISSGTLSPVFASGTSSYMALVSNATTSITLTPTTSDATATVTVNGTTVTSGTASAAIALNVGSNTITTVATAQDGVTTQTYTLTVTRVSNDATLSNLAPSAGSLSPAFAASTTGYSTSVSNTTSSIAITPTVNNAGATVTVNSASVTSGSASAAIPLSVGNNTITTVVTAQDGTTTMTYTLTVTRTPSADANLSSLAISSGSLSPAFTTATNNYSVLVANTVSSVTITPVTEEPNATITVNGVNAANNAASGAIALSVGSNVITSVVTAQDGSTTNIYTLNVTRAQASNANLSALGINQGTLSPVFASATNGYTASVANSVNSLTVTPTLADVNANVTVNGTAVSSSSASGSIDLNVGANTITIVAIAQDGVTTNTYTITVTRAGSADANLSNLTASGVTLTPAFSAATTNYAATVSNATASITLTPVAEQGNATIQVNGNTLNSGSTSAAQALAVGSNTISTVVTAQDGTTTQTYTVTITRLSNNANLSALTLSSGILSPAFAQGTNSYTASVANSVNTITVTPSVAQANASVKVNGISVANGIASGSIGLNVGSNTITTVVTAQDGSTTNTYTVAVTRAGSPDADLSNFVISEGTLTPAFSAATTSYAAGVPNTTAFITVIPTVAEPNATVKVNGTAVSSGSTSGAIILVTGSNTITTVVTAQDGTTKAYTLTVTKTSLSNNANLASIALSSGSLLPVFAASTISYTASVSNATTSITLTPTLADATATVTVNGTSVSSGSASGVISLNVGSNTITTVVTAQDGVTRETYTLVVTRARSANNNLSAIAISSGILSPVFAQTISAYTSSVSNSTSSITLTPTVADATATITVNGTAVNSGAASVAINLTVGNNTITTVVTAQNGTTQTYTVTVTRAQSSNNNLAGLTLSSGTLSPVFAQATTAYTASVTNSTTNITLTPTVADATATITVNGTVVNSGSASGAINLSVGNNTIIAVVTAQNGTPQTYTLTVNRVRSGNNNLAGLTLSSGVLSPVFASATTTGYTASVANTTTSITLTPTVADATATVTVNGTAVNSGSASAAINLSVGNNIITTVITAQNGTAQTYTVTVNRAQSDNNNLAGLTLSSGTLSPVFASATLSYTASTNNTGITVAPTLADATATQTVNGATVSSGSASATIPLVVGSNIITVLITAQNGVTNTYTINVTRLGLSQTITFPALNAVTYGAGDSTPAATSTNSGLTITYTSSNTAVATITAANTIHLIGAGTTTITANQSGNSSYNAATPVAQSLTVNAAPLSITALNQSKVYGAANPAFTATYSGFVNGETSAVLTTAPTLSTTATAASGATTYPITASGAVAANYTITYVAAVLTVTPAALTVTAANTSKIYGAVNPTFAATYNGFVNGDTQAGLAAQPTFSTIATALSTVGVYPVTASGATSPNYTIAYAAGTLTVSQAPLTIAAANQSKTYGSANPTLTATYTGFVNGDDATKLATQPTLTTTATTASPLANYPITVSGAAASNYSITYTVGTLSVGQAVLTVTVGNASKVYGAANPTFTATYSGFVNGDSQSVLTTLPSLGTTTTQASNAGPYAITASGAAATNYSFNYVAGTLTVTPAALTITAPNTSKIYGAANPTFAATYTGFVNGDTQAKLITQPTISSTAVAASPVGTYAITPSAAVSANYTITYVPGTLSVTPALLTITANVLSKTYGAALPTLTVTYTGFITGDSQASLSALPTITTTATAVSAVGTYPVTASGAGSGNYAIFYVAGTLTVNKAVLTITAANQTKTFGAANPAFTVNYSGFVNNDDATTLSTQPTITTTATTVSAVGSYPITVSGAVSSNYTITYVNGTLTVTTARNFVFNPLPPVTYGDPDFNPGAGVDTGEPITYASSNTSVATIFNGNIHIVGAGTAIITASIANNINYTNVSPISQTLTVNKASQTITFGTFGPLIKGSAPTIITVTSSNGYQVTVSSSDNGVASANNTGGATWAINPLQVGSTIITAVQAGDNNYLPALVSEVLVVRDDNNSLIFVNPALSPNGDGVNDYLVIEGIKNYPDNKLTIVNRNGAKVYQKDDYDNLNQLFDGHSSTGAMLQSGSYFYLLEYRVNGEMKKKVGYIVLKY